MYGIKNPSNLARIKSPIAFGQKSGDDTRTMPPLGGGKSFAPSDNNLERVGIGTPHRRGVKTLRIKSTAPKYKAGKSGM